MKTNLKYNMEISGTPIDPINDCIDNLRDTINDYNKRVHSNTDMHRVVVIGGSDIKSFENLLRSMFNREYYYLFCLFEPGSNSNIVVPDSIIPNVNSTKFLGLTIDSTLSWKGHILDLSINQSIGMNRMR